jgi:hypothetical protein
MGGWRRTGIDAWFMGAFTSVTGIERRDVERAPVGHFHIVVSCIWKVAATQKMKLEMTRFWHVTVPSLGHEACSILLISPSARPILKLSVMCFVE